MKLVLTGLNLTNANYRDGSSGLIVRRALPNSVYASKLKHGTAQSCGNSRMTMEGPGTEVNQNELL